MKQNMAKMLPFLLLLLCVQTVTAKTFKVATISPDGTAWMKAMRAGAAQIKQQTHGRVKFKFYPGGVMGSSKVVLRKIRIGQLQGGALTMGDLVPVLPDMTLYGLPFLFHSLDQVDRVRQQMDARLIKGLAGRGFVSFGFAEGGFAYMMSDDKLDLVADVQRKKVWIPTGHAVGEAVFDAAGISPVELPLSDVMTGLQTGLIDTVITSPIGVLALQWHTHIKYVIDEPLSYFAGTLVLKKRAFDRLKAEDQAIVRRLMTAVYRKINARNRKDNISARAAMIHQGIQFVPLTPAARKEWHQVADRAKRVLGRANHFSKPVHDELMQLISATR